ncbi:hypothetical protein Hanom_Chr15g01379591 [Helianthus anomalus]
MRLIFLRPSLFCALRLGPRRGLCALSALSAFNNYGVHDARTLVARCEGDARCILGAPNISKRKEHLNQPKK